MRSTLVRLIVLLAVAAAAGVGYYVAQRVLPTRHAELPLAQAKRGDLVVRSFVRGELRAVRTVTLTAPNLGTSTQLTRLASTGDLAQFKDLLAEFDDSELQARLEDDSLEVAQVEELIRRAEAEQKIRRNQDQVDLLRGRYAVRRAELEVRRNELVSAIDARKNVLTLEEARRSLAKLEEDVKSRILQGDAELAVLRERRRKALMEVDRSKSRIEQTRLLAPMTGLVAVQQNRGGDDRGMRMMGGGQGSADIREGDQISPGSPVVQVLDLSELEVFSRVNELERASLREGQEVVVRLDALPGKVVHGKIKTLSMTASSSFFSSDPVKRFDCMLTVDMRELLAHIGASPEHIERLMTTAAENAKRFDAAPTAPQAAFGSRGPEGGREGGSGGGRGREGGFSGGRGREGGREGGFSGGRGREGGQAGGAQGLSDAERQRMREALQQALGGRNAQEMSQEERRKLFEGMRQKMGAAGGQAIFRRPGEGGGGQRGGGSGRPTEATPGGEGPPSEVASLSLRQGINQQFTAEDRANAELPQPLEGDALTDIVLRPGLLAEAEIIVEKVANAIYVPHQAIFEKGDKRVVYVRAGERFETRTVKLGIRTESQVAVVEGLREGEWIALADPEQGPSPGSKKDKAPAKGDQPPLPAAGKTG